MMAVFDVAAPKALTPLKAVMLLGLTWTGRELPVKFGLATGAYALS
jgi:hypothetical protein